MLFIDVQVPGGQRGVAFGQRREGGLEPVPIVQGAGFDQAQVACAEGADQQRQFDVPLRVVHANHCAHRQGRLHLQGGARCFERAFGQTVMLQLWPGQRVHGHQCMAGVQLSWQPYLGKTRPMRRLRAGQGKGVFG
ncbi:hypothetical protein D3C80_856290 [compost metagenome]